MEVVKPGTKAVTVIGEISGLITALMIRNSSIRYEFSYFNGGEYKSEWLDSCELNIIDPEKIQIGFKTTL